MSQLVERRADKQSYTADSSIIFNLFPSHSPPLLTKVGHIALPLLVYWSP